MSVVESLFLPVGFKFLRQRREYFDTVHQPAQPIALCLQRSIDRLRIQSRIDGGMGQALMVQDILNRREIFSGDRQVTRTGPPKIVDGHILHIPVSADLVPDLPHAANGPRLSVVTREDPFRSAREPGQGVHHLHRERDKLRGAVFGAGLFQSRVVQLGSLADATFTVLVEDGNVSTLSDNAPVVDEELLGLESFASFIFSDDDKVRKIGYNGSKRYVRLTITPASNTRAWWIAAIAIQGHPTKAPVS
jgi:hypothetical protein